MTSQHWKEFWTGLEIGDGVEQGILTIFPLFHQFRAGLDYLTLEEAVRSNGGRKFHVEEVSTGGSVTDLRVVNGLDKSVLIVEGEILFGAKQTRTIYVTTLIGGNSRVIIPVACVEAGRWGFGRFRQFGVADSYAHAKMRSDKLQHIAMARKSMGRVAEAGGRQAYPVGQSEVWEEVGDYMADMDVGSPTSNADEVYQSLKKTRSAKYSFDYPEGCSGLAVTIDDHLVAVDCFDRPSTMQRMFPRLMEGYILEAQRSDYIKQSEKADGDSGGDGEDRPKKRRWWLGGRQQRQATPPRTTTPHRGKGSMPQRLVPAEKPALKSFLEEVGAANSKGVPGLALGEDMRAEGVDWSGAALAFDGKILHGELFPWGA
jgi:hypothetical protein